METGILPTVNIWDNDWNYQAIWGYQSLYGNKPKTCMCISNKIKENEFDIWCLITNILYIILGLCDWPNISSIGDWLRASPVVFLRRCLSFFFANLMVCIRRTRCRLAADQRAERETVGVEPAYFHMQLSELRVYCWVIVGTLEKD